MRAAAILLCLISTSAACSAAPISLTFQSTGSGSLNNAAFSNTAYTITGRADTSNNLVSGTITTLKLDSAQLTLQGIGSFDFLTQTHVSFANSTRSSVLPTVGFLLGESTGLILIDGPESNSLFDWAFHSSIGPLTGSATIEQWGASTVQTSGGVIVFNVQLANVTFSATVIPEPSVLLLTMGGMTSTLLYHRRRPTSHNRV